VHLAASRSSLIQEVSAVRHEQSLAALGQPAQKRLSSGTDGAQDPHPSRPFQSLCSVGAACEATCLRKLPLDRCGYPLRALGMRARSERWEG
jgi:hypothetical protein